MARRIVAQDKGTAVKLESLTADAGDSLLWRDDVTRRICKNVVAWMPRSVERQIRAGLRRARAVMLP